MNVALRKAIIAQIRGDWDEVERLSPKIAELGSAAGDQQASYFEVGVLSQGAIVRGIPVPAADRVLAEVKLWTWFPGIELEGAWVAFHTDQRDMAVALYRQHKSAGFEMRLIEGA